MAEALRSVRRRPGRPGRRPDRRRADHQRPAARPRPARPARRAVRLGPRGTGHAPQDQRGAPVHPAQRADRGARVGRPGPGTGPVQPGYVRSYDSPVGPARAGRGGRPCTRLGSSGCAGWPPSRSRSGCSSGRRRCWPSQPRRPRPPARGDARARGRVMTAVLVAGAGGPRPVPAHLRAGAAPGQPGPAGGRVRRGAPVRAPAGGGRTSGSEPPAARPAAGGVLRGAGLGVPVAAGQLVPDRQVIRELPGHQGAAGPVRVSCWPPCSSCCSAWPGFTSRSSSRSGSAWPSAAGSSSCPISRSGRRRTPGAGTSGTRSAPSSTWSR